VGSPVLAHVRHQAGDDVGARVEVLLDRDGRGCTNAEIASQLYLGEATVKTHVNRIFAKLGVRDRTQAVIVAYESGLVRPGG